MWLPLHWQTVKRDISAAADIACAARLPPFQWHGQLQHLLFHLRGISLRDIRSHLSHADLPHASTAQLRDDFFCCQRYMDHMRIISATTHFSNNAFNLRVGWQ